MKFILALVEHRALGILFYPYLVKFNNERSFFEVYDRLNISKVKVYENLLDPEEIELIKLIENYSDNNIFKFWGKGYRNFQEFLNKTENKYIEKYIRPHIENTLIKIIEIIQNNNIPIYKKLFQNNIYINDLLEITKEPVETIFNFNRNDGFLTYFLTFKYQDKEIKLTGKEIKVITNEPCSILMDDTIYVFQDIDSKKLIPFINKEYVIVPPHTEDKFFTGFVKKIIQKYNVKANGFEIINKKIAPSPILSIDYDLSQKPVFVLKFKYDDLLYYANNNTNIKVTYNQVNENKIFYKYERDNNYENEILLQLLELGLINTYNGYLIPIDLKYEGNEKDHYKLVNWININYNKLKELNIEIENNIKNKSYFLSDIYFNFEVNDKLNDWFDIKINIKAGDFVIPFKEIYKNIKENKREYILPDGKILILPEEWFVRLEDIISFVSVSENKISLKKQYYTLLENLSSNNLSFSEKIKKWIESKKKVHHELPNGINAELRPYQVLGYSWLYELHKNKFGGCLADDMGLGKTIQTLVLLKKIKDEEMLKYENPKIKNIPETVYDLFENNNINNKNFLLRKPSLIVVPTSLIHNWLNEIQKFVPSLHSVYYGGPQRKNFEHYYKNFDIILISYRLLLNEVEKLKNYIFKYIILDESQFIKNPFSKTYQALLNLKSEHRLVLTGTPIENSLIDLWAQINFVNPGLLGTFSYFKNEFYIPIEKKKDQEKILRLKKLVSPFILRRTKKEVAPELPEVMEEIIYCDMTDEQAKYYEKEKSLVRNFILENIKNKELTKKSIIILKELMKLRQIANHPVLIDDQYNFSSGKYEAIINNMINVVNEGYKALIFSSYVKHLNLFIEYCQQHNINYLVMTGNTPSDERNETIKKFQNDKTYKIFFITLKTGGFGLNLTAADYVFLLDPWWNPAVEYQALSRAHRIGREKNVFFYKYISKYTIEEKILKLQEKKKNLQETFIESEQFLQTLSEEELLNLVE